MKTSIISVCPGCGKRLEATRLSCNICKIDITGEFTLSKFDVLAPDDLKFLETFLAAHGSFKALQAEYGMSYPLAKKHYKDILTKLEIVSSREDDQEKSSDSAPKKAAKPAAAGNGEPKRRGRPRKTPVA